MIRNKIFTVKWFNHAHCDGSINYYDGDCTWASHLSRAMDRDKITSITSITVDDRTVWTKKNGWNDSFFLIQYKADYTKVEDMFGAALAILRMY